jgi:hypothetical protein
MLLYQRLSMTSGAQIPWLYAYIHSKLNGFYGHRILGVAYRYDVKIENKFKQKRRYFGSSTPHSRRREKVAPTHKKSNREKMATLRTTNPIRNIRRVMRS